MRKIFEIVVVVLVAIVTGCALEAIRPLAARAQDTPVLPNPLRLEDVRAMAREQRAEVAAAGARARGAMQRPAVVGALEDPIISPSIDHLPASLEGADVSLGIEQRFPLSGVRGDRRRGAEAEAIRLQADVTRTQFAVELEAVRAFLMLHERREMLRIVEQQETLARELAAAAAGRYAGATGSQADVLRAEIEIARFDGTARALAAQIAGAEAMLATAVDLPAATPIPPLQYEIRDTSLPTREAVRDAALRNRPELRGGEAEIERAQAEVRVMESMYRPMAMVRAGPSYTMADGLGGMAMIGLSIPLWRKSLGAGVAEAEAMADMARADLEAMRRMTEGEASAARDEVAAAIALSQALRDEVVPRARQTVTAALSTYGAGSLPLVSVVDAAQALWSAQSELVQSEVALGIAWAMLERAAGGLGGQ